MSGDGEGRREGAAGDGREDVTREPFGARVRRLREERGWTVETFSRRVKRDGEIGCHTPHIRQIEETWEVPMSEKVLQRLAGGLEMDPAQLWPAPRYCQPGDQPARVWLLMFEDPDRGISTYTDEEEARAAFAQADVSWNCYLFATVEKK